ncbi:MAG: glucosamine-6-phosphate deaminase [Planctomycetota bacterium]|nr:MAG: glucosamine-6-phosphate deaminase [Planctomycetota bacterium]
MIWLQRRRDVDGTRGPGRRSSVPAAEPNALSGRGSGGCSAADPVAGITSGVKIVLTGDGAEAARLVADEILAALRAKPNLVLGLPTGSTPIGVYEHLRAAYAAGEADFSRVHTFNLDEYLDLPAEHPQSYRFFMQEHLFSGVNVPAENIHFPPSEGDDLVRRCAEYEETIERVGGIDIMLLGMGRNGHIGFNEPTSSLASRTRVKTLTRRTLDDNARFYAEGEEQPVLATTMGIGTILDARKILLQAIGAKKARAVQAAVEGPVSSFFPASALQLHPDVTCYFDPEAAELLRMKDYYRSTRAHELRLKAEGRLAARS